MRAVRCLGNCRIEIIEKERPMVKPGWVLLRMRASAICGSDLHGIYEQPQSSPFTPGHEFMGEVVEAGPEARVAVGARVAAYVFPGCGECIHCRRGDRHLCIAPPPGIFGWGLDGGDAEYVLVPERCCLPVPEDMSDEVATLTGDLVGVSWHQFSRIGLRAHQWLVVSGLGPIGLGAVIVGKYLSARVVGIDINPYRRELASRLGAEVVLDAMRDDCAAKVSALSEGGGIEVGAECAGRNESLRFLLDHAAKGGHICLMGEHGEATFDPSGHFLRRDLTMSGSTYFNISEYQDIVKLIRATPHLADVITHRYPLSEAAEAFAQFKAGKTGKVVLTL